MSRSDDLGPKITTVQDVGRTHADLRRNLLDQMTRVLLPAECAG